MPEQTLSIGQALDQGVAYAMAGNHESACGLYRGVLMHEPENFEAVMRLGSSLFEMKRHHEALYWFWRGKKINRRHPLALSNYGLCVSQLGHPEEGLEDLERAACQAERHPISPQAKALIYNNMGNTLERLGRHKDALAALDKGIALDPADPFPHYNRGIALLRLNRHREAIEALNLSLTLRPPANDSVSRLNNADAIYNRGMARLVTGDLGGFADYEARLLTTENEVPNLGLPADKKWDGSPLAGKTILVHCEQGIGDDIQFFRFLKPLAKLGPKDILVVAHRATAPLLAGLPVTVLPSGISLPVYDCWVALMSLPFMLGIANEADLPPPYEPLMAPAAGFELDVQTAVLLRPDMLNVGVVWAGNWQHKNDLHRSIPLETFAALFDAPGCNFLSLQQMRPGETTAFGAIKAKHDNVSALWLSDLRDTAAVIRQLDLVISVDTAVAHLAGSLGVPTSILIPAHSTDWRWQLIREDSPWYPSARLYRQPKVGDWASVLKRLKGDLSAKAAQRAAA